MKKYFRLQMQTANIQQVERLKIIRARSTDEIILQNAINNNRELNSEDESSDGVT